MFTSRLCGDSGDPFQTLWGMRWFHDAILALRNPFFTDRVYYPEGSTLIFETFDLPSTVLMLPLWGLLPEVAIYNTAVILALSLTVYGMSRLVRDVTNDSLIGLLAGALFVMVPYQFAHLQGHLHLLAMGWLPLYVLFLLRFLRDGCRARDALLAGVFLGLASLASWYHLLYALVLSPPLLVYAAIAYRPWRTPAALLRGGGLAVLVYLSMVGPLLTAILVTSGHEEVVGAHDVSQFSADLYAFAYPNAAQGWSAQYGAHFTRWSGNSTENAAYVGFTILALALVGATSSGLARAFVVAAACGAVLALGPFLHVDGRALPIRMPYWLLERTFPAIELMGIPERLAYVMYLGLIVAAGIGLKRIASAESIAPPFGVIVIIVLACVAAYEYRPRPLITTEASTPAPMRAWADTPGDWAVLDVWDWYRPMWHATLHRKPMVGGYLTRVPKRLNDWMYRQPILRSIILPGQNVVATRTDRTLDFAWGTGEPDPSFVPGAFTAEWNGTLWASTTGRYEFELSANDGGDLRVDDTVVVQCATGNDLGCQATATIPLATGRHQLHVDLVNRRGAADLHVFWRPPGGAREILSSDVLETIGGRPGLDATYEQSVDALSGLGRERGRAALRALHVRYVITRDVENLCVQRELELPLVYRDAETWIYELPPPA